MKKNSKKEEVIPQKKVNPVKMVAAFIVTLLPLAILLFVIFSYGPSLGIYILPQSPKQYVKQAVSLMDTQGIYANTTEWEVMKRETLENAKQVKNYDQAHELVNAAIQVAGGKSSRLVSEEEYVQEALYPEVTELEDDIVMIKLPEFAGNDVSAQHYADVSVAALEKALTGAKGIIIDLRDNRGGNLAPMIGAIEPLIPDGAAVSFDINNFSRSVSIAEGTVNGAGYTVKVKYFKMMNLPVAVLQNEKTSGSGEITLLAFKGCDYVETFGTDTEGYCSYHTTRKMYDGAQLQLTVGSVVTRTEEVFCEEPIAPDHYSEDPVQDAIEWIKSK